MKQIRGPHNLYIITVTVLFTAAVILLLMSLKSICKPIVQVHPGCPQIPTTKISKERQQCFDNSDENFEKCMANCDKSDIHCINTCYNARISAYTNCMN